MIEDSTEFGARVARHLREETVVWLTTVSPSGAPLARPGGRLRRARSTPAPTGERKLTRLLWLGPRRIERALCSHTHKPGCAA